MMHISMIKSLVELLIKITLLLIMGFAMQFNAFSQPDSSIWKKLELKADSCGGLCTTCEVQCYKAISEEYEKYIDYYYNQINATFTDQIKTCSSNYKNYKEMDSVAVYVEIHGELQFKTVSRLNALIKTKNSFIEAHKAWNIYRDNSINFIKAYYFQYGRGSMFYIQGAFKILEINKFRAYELKRYYELLDWNN